MRIISSLALVGISHSLVHARPQQLQTNTVTSSATTRGLDRVTTVTAWAECSNSSATAFGSSLTSAAGSVSSAFTSTSTSTLALTYSDSTATLTITSGITTTVTESSSQPWIGSYPTISEHPSAPWYTNTSLPAATNSFSTIPVSQVALSTASPYNSSVTASSGTVSISYSTSTAISPGYSSSANGTDYSYTYLTASLSSTLPIIDNTISPSGTTSSRYGTLTSTVTLPISSSIPGASYTSINYTYNTASQSSNSLPSSSTSPTIYVSTSTLALSLTTSYASSDSPKTGSSSVTPYTTSTGSIETSTITYIASPASSASSTSSATYRQSTTCVTYPVHGGSYTYIECLSVPEVTPTLGLSSSNTETGIYMDSTYLFSGSTSHAETPSTRTPTLTISGSTAAVTGFSSISTSPLEYPTLPTTPSTLIYINSSSTIYSSASTDAVTGTPPSSYTAPGYPTGLPTTSSNALITPTSSSPSPILYTGSTDPVTGSSLPISSTAESSSYPGETTTCVPAYGGKSVCFTLQPSSSSIIGASSTGAMTGSTPTAFLTYSWTTSEIYRPSSTPPILPGSYPTYPFYPSPGNYGDDEHRSGHKHGNKGYRDGSKAGKSRNDGWKRFMMV